MTRYEIDVNKFFSRHVQDGLWGGRHKKLIIASDGTTLLHLAAKNRNETMTRYFLKEKLDVNAINSAGETPLMIAIRNHTRFHIWKILLEAGADTWKIKNNSGQTATMMCIQRNIHCEEFLQLIVKDIESKCGNIAEVADALVSAGLQLYHLKIFDKVEITKGMLARGCDINLQDTRMFEDTALHIAAKMNDLENVKVLVQNGADKPIENNFGFTAIISALESGNFNTDLLDLLLPDSKDWLERHDNLSTIFEMGNKNQILQLLLNRYDDFLRTKKADGQTPLHFLMSDFDVSIGELLKNVKLDMINDSDNSGKSALHEAVRYKNLEAIRFLLDAGANVDVLDKDGRSPLFYVLLSYDNQKENVKCRELLLQSGANMQIIDKKGNTIISYLTEKRYVYKDTTKVILAHLAINEANGLTLNSTILKHINENENIKDRFMTSKIAVNWMKTTIIFGQLTLFKFLIEEEKKNWQWVRNDEILQKFLKIKCEDYFYRLIMKRFEQAVKISHLYLLAGQLISKYIPVFNGNYVVLETILDFFSTKDLEMIVENQK